MVVAAVELNPKNRLAYCQNMFKSRMEMYVHIFAYARKVLFLGNASAFRDAGERGTPPFRSPPSPTPHLEKLAFLCDLCLFCKRVLYFFKGFLSFFAIVHQFFLFFLRFFKDSRHKY